MAENPLLPHAELKALYQLLRRASVPRDPEAKTALRSASSRSTVKAERSEVSAPALLAGTLLQLRQGDILLPAAGDQEASRLMGRGSGSGRNQPFQQASTSSVTNATSTALLACGAAAALGKAGQGGVALAFCNSGSAQPQWQSALEWAQKDLLPLVLVCADPSGTEALRSSSAAESPEVLQWPSLQKAAGRLQLPVLTVDGEDAVAVYRVMQESALRARSGGGAAILWAVLPQTPGAKRRRTAQETPLVRLEHFLRTRQIAIPS